ncbi:epimerase family protein SDR39U1 [Sitophilus oryzae]|uniref:Epimerase family protein SDR39U1 n=1 Tax=Sitophilus oryzae TaxID=7048 RepID=A0A6J2XEE3_SITOR|nr:epimerase family protein SDR39U1 [Sitophilus oryzae]
MSGNVLIGGGTGFVGKHLRTALQNKNYGFTIVSRMPGPQHISWNQLNNAGLPKDTVAVVNLAGQNVMDFKQRWSPGFKQNVVSSRVNTTASLAKAINDASVKPKAFVTMSGVGIYKPDCNLEYTECSKTEPFDFFSKLVLEWEKATSLDSLSKNHCRVISIRSGVVLGKDGGMIKQLYFPFFLGLGGPVGDGKQFMPWIHIDDLVKLIIFAIENDKVEGVLNGVAPNPCTNKEFSIAFAKALRRPAYIPTPKLVFNVILGKERAKMITEGQKVLPERTQEVGFKFQYPTVESACENIVKSI